MMRNILNKTEEKIKTYFKLNKIFFPEKLAVYETILKQYGTER